MSRTLILDVETAPNVAYVWKFWKENIGAKQVLEHTTIMSIAWKWLDEKNVLCVSNYDLSERELLKVLIHLLDEADFVVAHNGKAFDLPTIKGRALVHGLNPPSPYKTIDTRIIAKTEFRFPSNSQEYLADILGCTPKTKHPKFPGFELWSECLKGNPEAWEEMEEYNKDDVVTLEEIYLKMRPWDTRHPNVVVGDEPDRILCPKCGSSHIQRRGYVNTNTGKYHKFQCQDCGGWGRSRYTLYPKDKRHALLVNAG